MQRISTCTPNIRQLSLMGNPGVRSTFNGGSLLENNEYMWVLSRSLLLSGAIFFKLSHFRMYVIRLLPNLDYLDDVKISADQRIRATASASGHTMNLQHSLQHFAEHSISVPNMRTISKYDAKMDCYFEKHRNGLPKYASLKRSGSRFDRFWNRFWCEFFKFSIFICVSTAPVFSIVCSILFSA